MKNVMLSWTFWALLSAAFAALTAIFAKIGIENVNSDFATFIRTIVILLAAGLMVYATGNWQPPSSVSGRTWLFLVLSGFATGASWISTSAPSSSAMPPASPRSTNSAWSLSPCSP